MDLTGLVCKFLRSLNFQKITDQSFFIFALVYKTESLNLQTHQQLLDKLTTKNEITT